MPQRAPSSGDDDDEMARGAVALLALLLLLFVAAGSPCYIKSCFRLLGSLHLSGKRSDAAYAKKCPPCGPSLTGTCRGPRVCCGPFGCTMGVEAARHCLAEQVSLAPCSAPYARPCRSVEGGECATRHLCCNEGGCLEDSECAVD